ncbi:acyl-CoA dehydrogenase family protein [Halioxenophilus aromaticivorans]|uniref:Acyl-CoA dehydrogenase family protein n=1 Tax=Halioxenophilus aromaticivorans TaxID=1306992 RepID=A0AAV3TXD0_9ALTE
MFDLDLNDTQQALVDSVKKVCSKFDDQYWTKHEQSGEFPFAFFDAMAELGILGMATPEAYGGSACSIEDTALVLEAVAASGAGINGCSTIHLSMFGFHPVICHGSEALKQKYLPRIASGDLHVSFSVTEPDAGSDTSKITTKAVKTDGGWLLSGRKVWLTKAHISKSALVLARTSAVGETKRPIDGLSLFVVDFDDKTTDISLIPKMGRRCVGSCEVVFDNTFIPEENLVGEIGKGFYNLLDGLNPERVFVAAEGVGVGRVALERGVRYANERSVFGRLIGQNQGVQHPLADAHMQLNAAHTMYRVAARLYDQGKPCGEEANTAKFLAGRAANYAVDRAFQTHGGMGMAVEYQIERWYREIRLIRIAPVSEEQIMNYIGEKVLGLPRSY